MSLPANIDSLKSTISRRGGLARPNRFAIYLTHPSTTRGSLLNLDLDSLVNSFVGGGGLTSLFNDPRDMFLLCDSVTVPGKRITTMEQTTSHFTAKKPYSMLVEEVTMTFNLTNDYYVRKYFDEWQDMIINPDSYKTEYKKNYCKDITIQQLTPSNDIVPSYSVKLESAYPVAISSVDLSNSADNTVAQMTVSFAYTVWKDLSIADGFGELASMGSDILGETASTVKKLFN
jgi:hypothetical protein